MSAVSIRGLVLAGGRSRRFRGTDKTFITLCGRPLWQHALSAIAPQVDAVAFSSNDAAGQLAADLQAFRGSILCRTGSSPARIDVLPDLIAGYPGPLAGIHAGLSAWPDCYVATVAVDLPAIPPDLVERLYTGLRRGCCAYASDGTRHALALLWAPGSAPLLHAFLSQGRRSVREWLTAHGDPVLFTAPGEAGLFININTQDDLVAAEHHLRAQGRC